MATTAFTAAIVQGPMVCGIRQKKTKISLTFPTVWAAAGVALDLSAAALGGYEYIEKWHFIGAAATDYQVNWDLISATKGTGTAANCLTASTCKVVGHQGAAKTGNAQAATVFGSCADSENHSTKTIFLIVVGW